MRTLMASPSAIAGLAMVQDKGEILEFEPERLIMSIPLNRAMLSGDDEPPPLADLDRSVDAGVRVFLAAYGPG